MCGECALWEPAYVPDEVSSLYVKLTRCPSDQGVTVQVWCSDHGGFIREHGFWTFPANTSGLDVKQCAWCEIDDWVLWGCPGPGRPPQ